MSGEEPSGILSVASLFGEESEGETAIVPIEASPSKYPIYSRNVCARNHQAVEKGAEGGRGAIDATGSRETKIGGEYYERLMWRCIGKVVFPTQILEEAASRRTLVERLCRECILLTT